MGSGTRSYMRKGFLIYEEVRKYLVIYEPERPFMHFTDCCWFLISCVIELYRKWEGGGGGLKPMWPMCESDGGVRWQCGRQILLGRKVFLSHCQATPPTQSHIGWRQAGKEMCTQRDPGQHCQPVLPDLCKPSQLALPLALLVWWGIEGTRPS